MKHKIRTIVTAIAAALLAITSFTQAATAATAPTDDIHVTVQDLPTPTTDLKSTTQVTGLQETYKPTQIWDIAQKGKYVFEGYASSRALYTNYRFKGKTSYQGTVWAMEDNPVKVEVLERRYKLFGYDDITISTFTVGANLLKGYTVTTSSPSTEIFLKFKGTNGTYSYSFKGHIR